MTNEMSGGAPWQLEGFNNQPQNNQVQFYNPNQFASGAKGESQDNNTSTGAESGHYADWQQNYQNGYFEQQQQQQAGHYGPQDMNQQQQWNQDGSYIQTSQPGGAQVSGGEAMYAGYGHAQGDGAQGGVVPPGWNNADPLQYWDNTFDYQNQQNFPAQQQQPAYGGPSTMSSQPNAYDQASSFSQDMEADAEVQAYTSGLGTQAGAAQLPQQPTIQPELMQDVPLDEPAAAGQEPPSPAAQGVNLTSAASFPSLGNDSDPFASLNAGDQAPVPTWPQHPPVSQHQRALNAQPDKSVHSRQSSAGGNVQFVLGGSEAGSTDNSHSNSPAPFGKVNPVQGILEEPRQHQITPQQQQPQVHQSYQQQHMGDSWNLGYPQLNTSSNSSGWVAGVAETHHPPAHQGDTSGQPTAADDGWGWGGEEEEDDVEELLRQHDQQASTAETTASAVFANPSDSQAQHPGQPIEGQPQIPPDQVVPEAPVEGRQEASLGAAVAAEDAWPEMVDSGLNAGEVPNVGQPNQNVGQGHPGDSPQVNPGPPVYQRSPSQMSVHSTHSQQSFPGSDLPARKDRSYSSSSTISTHSTPSANQPRETPPTPVHAPISEVPPPGEQASPPQSGPPGPPMPGSGAQGDNPFRRAPAGNRFGPPRNDSGTSAVPQPPESLPVNPQTPSKVQPPNAHLASPIEPHPDSPFQPPVKSLSGESGPPQLQTPPQTQHNQHGAPSHQHLHGHHHDPHHSHHGLSSSHRKRGSRDSTMSPATTLWENQDITVGKNVQLFSPSLAQQEESKIDTSQGSSVGSGNAFFPPVSSNTSAQGSVLEHRTGSSAHDQSYTSHQSPGQNQAQNISQNSLSFNSPQSSNPQQSQNVNPQHQMTPPTSVAKAQHQMTPVSSSEAPQQSLPQVTTPPRSDLPSNQFTSQAGAPSSHADGYHGNQGHMIQQQNSKASHDTSSSNHSTVVQQPNPMVSQGQVSQGQVSQGPVSQGPGSYSESQPIPTSQQQPTTPQQQPITPQSQSVHVQQPNPQGQPQNVAMPPQHSPQYPVSQVQGVGPNQGMQSSNQGQSNVQNHAPNPDQQNMQTRNTQNWQTPVQNQPGSLQHNQGQNQMGTPQNHQVPQQTPHNPYGPPQNQYGPPQNQYGPTQTQYSPQQNQYGPPQTQYSPQQNQYGPPQNQYGPPQSQFGLPQDAANNQYSQNPNISSHTQPSPSQNVQSHNQGRYGQPGPQQFQQGPPNNQYAPNMMERNDAGQVGGYSQNQQPQQQPQSGTDDPSQHDDQVQRSQPPVRFPGQRAPPGQRTNLQQTNRQNSQSNQDIRDPNNEALLNRSASMTDAERYSRDAYYRSQYGEYYQSDPRYQGYDPYYRSPSRGAYRDDYYRDYYGRDPQYERPRTQQWYPDDHDRPRSVTDYERPRSRQGQPDDRPRSRPASRQGEENVSQSGSRPSSRAGREVDRPKSRNEYDRDYRDRRDAYYRSRGYQDYYGRDYYDNYYDYYGYQRDDRYSRGYLEEMRSYGQELGDYDRSRYERSYSQENYSDHDRGSNKSSRSTTPNLETAADQFAREFHQGSRPGSRSSGYEQSPIHPADAMRREHYSQGTYGYDYDPRYDRHYDYYRDHPHHHKPKEPARLTPVKFSIPHLRVAFGPGGQLIQVLPNNPSDGQPARVTVQDYMNVMMTTGLQEELKTFPGPLIKGDTHKNDVLLFCQNKIQECKENTELIDQQSAELIWRYLCLLIKQNGTVVGTDVCDLLLEGHEPTTAEFAASGMAVSLSSTNFDDVNEGDVTSDKSMINKTTLSIDEVTDRFRNLLLRGRKKDALEWAIKKNLWGHALFLASKMDTKTHASVMTRFANVSMKINDPLQTLYQLMSGRQPAAVTLMSDEKWGDWRPHLAMVLGNPTQRPDVDRKSVINLGDTLAAKGLLFASHFCYLMAQVPFGQYHKKSSKFVLIGSSHGLDFDLFATNEAIQCTEVFEYAISLGNPMFVLPTLQTYKLLYAYRLAENSMPEEALRYCEVLATAICQNPVLYQAQMVRQAYDLSTRLKYYDPERLQTSDDDHTDPVWIVNLSRVVKGFQDGSIQTVSGTQTPRGYGGSATGGSSEAGDYGQTADPTSQYVLQQQQYWQNYDPNQQYAYAQQWQQGQEGVAQGQEVVQGQTNQLGQDQADQSLQGQDQSADPAAWQQMNASAMQQPQQQQQQWAEWQQQYAADGSYLGYVHQQQQQEQQQQQTPEDAQPAEGAQPQETQRRRRTSTLSHDEPDGASAQPTNLGSSMNSNYSAMTSGTGTTEETEESQPGTPTPDVKESIDYYVASTKTGAPSNNALGVSGTKPTLAELAQLKQLGAPPGGQQSAGGPAQQQAQQNNNQRNKSGGGGGGWFSGIVRKIIPKGKNEMILPDDKNPAIVWDPVAKRWNNIDETEEEQQKSTAPPPKDMELMGTPAATPAKAPNATPAGAPPPSGNRFSRQKTWGARGQYVDVLASSSSKPSPAAPAHLFNVLPPASTATTTAPAPNIFVPSTADGQQPQQAQQNLAPQDDENGPTAEGGTPVTQASEAPPPVTEAPAPNNTAQPPSLPMMFNPSQFPTPQTAPSAGGRMKYGQRRAYPK